jgi:hypothetical protein
MAADAGRGDDRARALAAAALVGGVAAAIAYFAQRALDYARGRAADPAMVIASLRADLYYRMAVALWCGGAAGLVALALSGGRLDEARATRVARAIALSAPALLVAAVLAAWALP